jgi:hypothetical protein
MVAMPFAVSVPTAALALLIAGGLAVAGREDRLGRSGYVFWLLWARIVYPGGLAVFLLELDLSGSWILWLNILAYLAQLFVLGIKTGERLQDAGRSRWLGLLTAVPLLGVLPAAAIAALRPVGTAGSQPTRAAMPHAGAAMARAG